MLFLFSQKGREDRLSVVQIEQDFSICVYKLPSLICRPVAAQFMRKDVIALFEFEESENGVTVLSERHYKLVPPEEVTKADLQAYR